MEFYVLLALFAHSLQGSLAGLPVEVTPERIILLENRPLEVRCRVRQPILYCRFAVPGLNDALSLGPDIPPHEGIQYLGAGLEQGDCGMLIQRVSSNYSGIISCSMGLKTQATESKGSLKLIVARPPDPPILKVFPGSTYRDSFREGESIQANCRIVNARPVANISWYLGSEPIYDRLGPAVIEEENGLMSISQNMTKKVTYLDNGKDLKCVAGHIALGQGNINHSISKLNIRFPPKPKSQELEKFGFTIGQPGKIVVTFQANPIPLIVWKVDQENLKQGTRDSTGRFEAGILQHKGAGTWDAILLINSVRPEEVEKRYTLVAQNELGQESYKVAISTSPEPPADITAGTIVGIVIAVLVILLLVFILIFARATGRWCFAGGIPRPPGESHPSYRWFLGGGSHRSSEKVNSLVYKDYTLEYVDGIKKYVSPEEKAQLVLEGKLEKAKPSVKNERVRFSTKDSDSDTGYEMPVGKRKPKSCEDLHEPPKPEMRRNGSYPLLGGEISPGDNGILNLPPCLVPLETSFEEPVAKEKRRSKKNRKKTEAGEISPGNRSVLNLPPCLVPMGMSPEEEGEDADKSQESSSPDEVDPKTRPPLWKSETPEDAEVRAIIEGRERGSETEGPVKPFFEEEPKLRSKSAEKINFEAVGGPLETPVEVFPVPSGRYSHAFSLPAFPSDTLKNKRVRLKKIDPNPLKKMFGIKGMKKEEGEGELRILMESEGRDNPFVHSGRYNDADLSTAQSDTESADHGSADKSSVSKLTSEKPPKKLMNGLFGSFRRGRSKDKVADNDPVRNPSSFEITVKEQPEEDSHSEMIRTEGIVYAELDMARSPGSIMRKDDEKTEYAEIIYPGSKLTAERSAAELRKSRENLTSSRENLAEVDETYSTSGEGKKEAAV